MAKRKRRDPKEGKLSLTPLIDVVFQLIIFFMVVTEMARQEIENVRLPFARQAIDDTEPEQNRIILNVTKVGDVIVMGQKYNDGDDLTRLNQFLYTLAMGNLERPLPAAVSRLPVKIRADMDVEYKFVQRVMVSCMRAYIWKLSFGCREDTKYAGP